MDESTERVFHIKIVFIIPKMRNQHVLPAKNGSLEYMEHIFSTTTALNMIGKHILCDVRYRLLDES